MSNVIMLRSRPKILKLNGKYDTEFVSRIAEPTLEEIQKKREQELTQQIQATYQRGYNEGYIRAKNELEEEFTQALIKKSEEYYAILSGFEEKLGGYESVFDSIVLSVSLKIAEKIINREVAYKSAIEHSLREGIKKVIGANEIIIKLNPSDYKLLSEGDVSQNLERSFNKVKFEVTEKVEPGGCIIETEVGNVDARISSQLDEISNQLNAVYAQDEEQ